MLVGLMVDVEHAFEASSSGGTNVLFWSQALLKHLLGQGLLWISCLLGMDISKYSAY
jgi:hypothetical protein